ncbi:hypothetical protein K503DRAFT_851841 [Rhizopogon vinicolor AM-OR11-026]|uniref:Uncharacterized protein n=1 Tax=Rhizopogon vinicolor AM-OR11-026 TaxID=1314800 RepID=A0A1B7MM48_9AGAM|nr:hypothetical protein K503DRAFT_851841 [Rhizopogon vinicolor AM-OR11-026]
MVVARGPPPAPTLPSQKRSTNYGYYIPMDGGGSMLTQVQDTYPAGLGEPINVIISAYSDSEVLLDNGGSGGLINYFQSFGFSTECLGQHSGGDQAADLGDGNGYLNETAVIRWDYGDATLGTCQETVEGGNHFRYWKQNGPTADSGAIFMATSYEMPIAEDHNIIVNGYNLGRDWLVGNATAQSTILPTPNMINTSTDGINHYQSVAVSGSNAIDGLVALLTVTIVKTPGSSSPSGAEWSNRPAGLTWTLLAISCTILASLL